MVSTNVSSFLLRNYRPRRLVDPLFAFAFMQTFVEILYDYFGTVSAATLKDNFDVVYQVRLSPSSILIPRHMGIGTHTAHCIAPRRNTRLRGASANHIDQCPSRYRPPSHPPLQNSLRRRCQHEFPEFKLWLRRR